MAKVKKVIKTIKIDVDKCNGCRACEVICSAFHANPKYSSNNPARSRIRMVRDPIRDVICRFTPGNIPRQNAPAGTNTCWTAKNTQSAIFAGLRALPATFLKNPIPACR
jgi:ferredoxin